MSMKKLHKACVEASKRIDGHTGFDIKFHNVTGWSGWCSDGVEGDVLHMQSYISEGSEQLIEKMTEYFENVH